MGAVGDGVTDDTYAISGGDRGGWRSSRRRRHIRRQTIRHHRHAQYRQRHVVRRLDVWLSRAERCRAAVAAAAVLHRYRVLPAAPSAWRCCFAHDGISTAIAGLRVGTVLDGAASGRLRRPRRHRLACGLGANGPPNLTIRGCQNAGLLSDGSAVYRARLKRQLRQQLSEPVDRRRWQNGAKGSLAPHHPIPALTYSRGPPSRCRLRWEGKPLMVYLQACQQHLLSCRISLTATRTFRRSFSITRSIRPGRRATPSTRLGHDRGAHRPARQAARRRPSSRGLSNAMAGFIPPMRPTSSHRSAPRVPTGSSARPRVIASHASLMNVLTGRLVSRQLLFVGDPWQCRRRHDIADVLRLVGYVLANGHLELPDRYRRQRAWLRCRDVRRRRADDHEHDVRDRWCDAIRSVDERRRRIA